jgi:flagellum-specific ATP synthase
MSQVGQPAHLGAARQLKECYSTFEKIKELIPLGGYAPGADIKTDRAVQLAPTIERFLRQDGGEAAELETSVATLQNILGKPR